MAIAPAYYGVPTPLLVLGGLGATAGLIYVATRSRAPGAIMTPTTPAPPPEYGVEIGPAVIEAPPPVVAQVDRARRLALPATLQQGRYYRMRIELPFDIYANAFLAVPSSMDAYLRSFLYFRGFNRPQIFRSGAVLDPTWPPDALAGGDGPGTYWAQGYQSSSDKRAGASYPPQSNNAESWIVRAWEY